MFLIGDLIKNIKIKLNKSIILISPNKLILGTNKTQYIIIIISRILKKESQTTNQDNILSSPQWKIRNKINGPPGSKRK